MSRLLVLLFFISISSQAEVWTSNNQWNENWEKKFQEWVEVSWNKEFFSKKELSPGVPNPYFGIKVDCADTVYTMRAVFSFENNLPFHMNDHTTFEGKPITNEIKSHDRIVDPQLRFRDFLVKKILGVGSTISLRRDTYPVAITKETVVPGAVMITSLASHHSWTIQNILGIGIPTLIFSSRVNKDSSLQLQVRESWPSPYWVFKGAISKEGTALAKSGGGVRYWRPIEYMTVPEDQVPGYSEEQFELPLKDWNKTIQTKLADQIETDQDQINRLMRVVCDGYLGRVPLVQEAVDYVEQNPACVSYETYDIYSTPNRDRRVFDDLLSLRNVYQEIVVNSRKDNLPVEIQSQLDKVFPFIIDSALGEASQMVVSEVNEDSTCTAVLGDKTVDLAEFKRRLFKGLISSNPLDSFERRWGESAQSSNLAKKCKSWDSWAPDLTQD